MKIWTTSYSCPEEGRPLEVVLNDLSKAGHEIFSVMYLGKDGAGNREYCVVSYVELCG